MTTPPPSEGPSQEATAADYLEAANVVARFNADASPSTLSMRRKVLLGDLVAEAIARAKRSAHLEDARAGCAHCGQGLVPIHDVVDGWVHDEDGADCKRPEVWDALSLPTGKPSGTIKSTASEQPDGKTR